MATLHVRNVPDELYISLRQIAADSHRSLSAEVIDLLDAGVATRSRAAKMTAALEHLSEVRRQLPAIPEGYAAELIRESRGDIIDP
jgi:plasmid stability protein